jgi:hypothetical protein
MTPNILKKIAALAVPKGIDPTEFARLRMLYRPLRTRLSWFSLPGVLGLIGGVMMLIFFAPLRAWEVVPILTLVCVVPALLLTRGVIASLTAKLPVDLVEVNSGTLIQRHTSFMYDVTGLGKNWQLIADKNLRQSGPVVILYCFFGMTLLMAGAVMCVNQILDGSEGVAVEATVQEKILTHGKHGSKNYFLRIASPTTALLSIFDLGETEDLRVNRSIFDRATEGSTTVTLTIHEGLLGMPWYQLPHDAFGDLKPEQAVSPARRLNHRANAADIAAACAWRDGFNLATEIGHAPAQDFRREFWPNGALKAEEPLINGVVHGVGQYWFDNATRYANIPYKQGQKHGTFNLHRADGSIEQQLSYKDGLLFGINTWYDASGHVTATAVYTGDNEHFPLTYCNGNK